MVFGPIRKKSERFGLIGIDSLSVFQSLNLVDRTGEESTIIITKLFSIYLNLP